MDAMRASSNLLEALRRPDPVLVLTGAGISAESGLATFRGAGGLWEGHDPFELATPEAFERDPHTVWRFYAWRRQQALRASPNAAHLALARFERARPGVSLVTQNVDGLHERAGSVDPIRLHGSLWRTRCTAEGIEIEDTREDLGPLPPRCRCGALLRPAVVWFGEALSPEMTARAHAAARTARLVLVVGTSSVVQPAASLPLVARASGAWIVEINPEPTPLTPIVDERFAAPAGEVLPPLFERTIPRANPASSLEE